MSRLSGEQLKRMSSTQRKTDKVFMFGETRYVGRKIVEIPCQWGRRVIYIRTHVVDGDLPWLLGRETMNNLDVQIDIGKECVISRSLNWERIKLRTDSKGHLRVPLVRQLKQEEVWSEHVLEATDKDLDKKLRKLHLQFGHPGYMKLYKIIEQARGNKAKQGDIIREKLKLLTENCETCLRCKRTPSKPSVGLPMAKEFNEVVAIDIGFFQGDMLLVIVDLATKYCQGCWVKSKKPEEIVE